MGILNSVGLQNPGVDAFIAEELPFLRQYDVKVIANISGNTPEEYGVMCEKLAGAGVDMIEVNISCPNVKAGGLAYGTRPELAAEVTAVAKAHAGRVPVMVKLSPNVTDVTEIARAVEAAGADAVSLINTIRGMRIDVNTRRPILKMNTGGLSGPAVLPVAVRMVWEVSQAVKVPVLGMGGVSKGEDAAQLRAYLETHLRPGETAELWNLWVGDGPARAFRFTGPLAALEPDTLEQLSEQAQTCLTIEI